MKKTLLLFSVACVAALTFAGCEKGDGDKDYGYPYVLMPQAQRIEGYYAVPGGKGEWTPNFKVEEENVLVYMGVLRSGKVKNEAFSVDIAINDTPAEDFIYDNIVPNAELMPHALYTLPETVSVPGNSNQTQFYMELSVSEVLKAQYDDKIFVLCVELQNPTKFKLSRDSFRTVVVVDVNAIREFL